VGSNPTLTATYSRLIRMFARTRRKAAYFRCLVGVPVPIDRQQRHDLVTNSAPSQFRASPASLNRISLMSGKSTGKAGQKPASHAYFTRYFKGFGCPLRNRNREFLGVMRELELRIREFDRR
jgi:hypothetical protein